MIPITIPSGLVESLYDGLPFVLIGVLVVLSMGRGFSSYHREMRRVDARKHRREVDALKQQMTAMTKRHFNDMRDALAFVRDQHQEETADAASLHAREIKAIGGKATTFGMSQWNNGYELGYATGKQKGRIEALSLITRTVKPTQLTVNYTRKPTE